MANNDQPIISVLLPTHNGENHLERVLTGYEKLGHPGFAWEMIIVDNASTDRTREIVGAFSNRLPITSCFESQPGKNRALNHGVGFVRSDCIVLTDDDAIPHPGFLNSWRTAFERNPVTDLFGATIIPLFDVAIPQWMAERKPRFEELYSRREDVPDGPIDADYIFGPNMAVRRRVFERGIHFDEKIGPQAGRKTYAMGSETAFCRAAAAAGCQLQFVSAPVVSHIVRAHQVENEFITGRARRMGFGTARKQFLNDEIRVRPAQGLRQTVRATRNVLNRAVLHIGLLSPNAERRFDVRWRIEFDRGFQRGVSDLRAESTEGTKTKSTLKLRPESRSNSSN